MTYSPSPYRLYQGDCLDIMPTLEAGSIDAVVTDPPYGTTACKWDSVIPFAPMWKGVKHVLKERGACVLFGSQPFTSALVMSNVEWFKYDWIWNKNLPTGFLDAKRRPMNDYETISIFSNGATVYNPQNLTKKKKKKHRKEGTSVYGRFGLNYESSEYGNFPRRVIRFSRVNNTVHPTQKPIALLEYLIKTYTNEGDTVLDFTMGSGTTGVACMNTGRNFIGIELDPDYYAIAQERIEEAHQLAAARKASDRGEIVYTDKEVSKQMGLFQ